MVIMSAKLFLWILWLAENASAAIGTSLSFASYHMLTSTKTTLLLVNPAGTDGGNSSSANANIAGSIAAGLLVNALLFVAGAVSFMLCSFTSLCSAAGPCMKGVRKAGKATLVTLSAGMGLASGMTAVHFSSLVNYVKALKDIGEEGIDVSVFMYALSLPLSLPITLCLRRTAERAVRLSELTDTTMHDFDNIFVFFWACVCVCV